MHCTNPICSADVSMDDASCRVCRAFQGFANVRHAASHADALRANYIAAINDAQLRNVDDKALLLEQAVKSAEVVISVSVTAADNILRNGKYLNYYRREWKGVRSAKEHDLAVRQMVDGRLFSKYFRHVHFFALTINGDSLRNYGSVALFLSDDHFLSDRASLIDRNSYRYFELAQRRCQGIGRSRG
jgi:hypothetical protein